MVVQKDVAKGNQRYTFFATSEDYLRIAKTIMNDYNSDSCIGDYLRTIYDNRVDKKKKQDDTKSVFAYTKQYGGQFHMSLRGTKEELYLQWMVMQVNKY